MATSALIIAESGSGKTTAGSSLNPKETFWINVANKPLPFKGWKKNYTALSKDNPKGNISSVSTPEGILAAMQYVNDERPEIKVLIIDDWQYASSFEYFDRATEIGFKKFNEIGQKLAQMARQPIKMRDNLIIYFLTHSEKTEEGRDKAKTIGKMVDNALTLEGLFSIVLFGKILRTGDDGVRYVFETNGDGTNTCKSPMGMFSDRYIPNDLKAVTEAIIKYEQ